MLHFAHIQRFLSIEGRDLFWNLSIFNVILKLEKEIVAILNIPNINIFVISLSMTLIDVLMLLFFIVIRRLRKDNVKAHLFFFDGILTKLIISILVQQQLFEKNRKIFYLAK